MTKHLVYATINGALFLFFLQRAVPVWLLFLGFSIYYFYKAFAKETKTYSKSAPTEIVYGSLCNFALDGDESDKSLGLYIRLNGRPVFVDIKEDEFVVERRLMAMQLYQQQAVIEKRLIGFIEKHTEFRERFVSSMGLHAKKLDQVEVFWEPSGYSLLLLENDRYEFVLDR